MKNVQINDHIFKGQTMFGLNEKNLHDESHIFFSILIADKPQFIGLIFFRVEFSVTFSSRVIRYIYQCVMPKGFRILFIGMCVVITKLLKC